MPSFAQNIKGEVVDMDEKKPMSGVSIENIYTNTHTTTNTEGKFLISAAKGELLEFKKQGYQTAHVRIPDGTIPPYFKIILEHVWMAPLYAGGDWVTDSSNEYEIYKHELEFPKMTTLDMIQHPFTAMSKQNQEIWQFQKDYEYTEEQKYIDYKFNKKIITKLTGLSGDSLIAYMRRYRPGYQQARQMSDYNFYSYIRHTVLQYRRSGYSPGRLSH